VRIGIAENRARADRVAEMLADAGLEAPGAFRVDPESGPVSYLTGYEPWQTSGEWVIAVMGLNALRVLNAAWKS
jgi:hypothetical protein